jgi:hypothetical protein
MDTVKFKSRSDRKIVVLTFGVNTVNGVMTTAITSDMTSRYRLQLDSSSLRQQRAVGNHAAA